MKRAVQILIWTVLSINVIIFLAPQNLQMPVSGADHNSYHPKSFWYVNRSNSTIHKGVDIFAERGTSVKAATAGLVLLATEYGKGGKFVIILGPRLRLHYYAHLNEIKTFGMSFVTKNSVIGTVGDTGDAGTTPSHLYYAICTLIPYPWRIDHTTSGWKKMFYLNPIAYLEEAENSPQK